MLGDKIGAKLLAEQAGVPVAAWSGGAVDDVEAARKQAASDRLPADDQGHRRRWRPGHPQGARRRPSWPRRSTAPAPRGPRRSATRRCSWSGWSTTPGTSRCRSSPTPTAPCGRSGVRDCTAQRRHQKVLEESSSTALDGRAGHRAARRRGAPGRARRVHQRRHRRVPLPARAAAVRLPRGQHPPAGGAPGHRADHRAGPGEAAAARRRRRAAGGRAAADGRLGDRGPAQRRGPPARLHPRAGADRDVRRAGRPGRPRGHRRRRGRRHPAGVRLDDRQDHRLRQRPTRGPRPAAAGTGPDHRRRRRRHHQQGVPARAARPARGAERPAGHGLARSADGHRHVRAHASRRHRHPRCGDRRVRRRGGRRAHAVLRVGGARPSPGARRARCGGRAAARRAGVPDGGRAERQGPLPGAHRRHRACWSTSSTSAACAAGSPSAVGRTASCRPCRAPTTSSTSTASPTASRATTVASCAPRPRRSSSRSTSRSTTWCRPAIR